MNHGSTIDHDEMVYVREGSFIMGVREDERDVDPCYPELDYLAPSRPQREIYLSAFYIDRYPITNAQYQDFINQTGYHIPQVPHELSLTLVSPYAWDVETGEFPPGLDRYPVVFVSYYDALAYCEWLGKRLPTEAGWEKAARRMDGRPYPWGWERDFERRANIATKPDVIPPLTAVDAYPLGVSPYGCWDMLGNVEEWCSDWYEAGYYRRMPARNPRGPRKGEKKWKVLRGFGRMRSCLPHVGHRGVDEPWSRNHAVGFRCACSAR